MADAHKNFAYSLVATAPSPASSGTSLVVTAADGAKFPAVPFNATIWPAGAQPTTANAEIVRVTLISTDTFTITRAQESSSARTVVIGDQIAATITAKTLTDVEHDQFANTYLTVADETIPASSQVIYEDYLELAASFEYELATDAILVIGDFATPLPAPDQNSNIFITVANETIPSNSEVMFSDFYELSPPFVDELSVGALLQVGTGTPVVPVLGLPVLYDSGYLPADAAQIDTGAAGIAQGHFALLVEAVLRSTTASTNDNITLIFNNDSGLLYDLNRIQNVNGTVTGASVSQGAGMNIGTVPAATSPAGAFGCFTMKIPAYDNPNNWKTGEATSSAAQSTVANNIQSRQTFLYESIVPISRLKITCTANWLAGSRLVIYGMQ